MEHNEGGMVLEGRGVQDRLENRMLQREMPTIVKAVERLSGRMIKNYSLNLAT